MYPSAIDQRYRETFLQLKGENPGHVVSRSFLRHDIPLKSNRSLYEANFLAENGQIELPQSRLSRTDSFMALMLGFFLLAEKDDKPGSAVLQTYPNPTVFAGAAALEDLEVFYNGEIDIQVNNVIISERFPLRDFRYVGETQKTGATSENSKGSHAGMVLLPPRVNLNGAEKNRIAVRIPSYAGIDLESGTAGETFKLVAYLDGFLIEGAGVGKERR